MKKIVSLSLFAVLFAGCASMSNFDQNSYNSATELKSETAALVAHATEPASSHKDEIDALRVKLNGQLAYERGKGDANAISAKQWEILVDPEGNLLGNFLNDWQSARKVYSTTYVQESGKLFNEAFDEILKLEGAKSRE